MTLQTNAIICDFGDSFHLDTSGIAPVTGYRYPNYFDTAVKRMFPFKRINYFNLSQSGVIMDRVLTNNMPSEAPPLWGYLTNSYQHVGVLLGTDNGALSSNQMYLVNSNIYLAPQLMSDGDLSLISHTGWCSTNTVDWVGLGYPPAPSSDGSPLTEGARNNASVNAGNILGVRGVDSFNVLSNAWVPDYNLTGGTNVQWLTNGTHAGHFLSGGALSWAISTLIQMFPSATNISLATVDWSTLTPTTNNCVLSSISKVGNVLTFNRYDLGLPPVWDNPGDTNASGTVTNNANVAFNLDSTYKNAFHFTITVPNIPAGNYYVKVDGEYIARNLSSSVLSAGWNMFTNTTGPYWRHGVKVLADTRDKDYVNEVTLISGSAGDRTGLVSYVSNASTQWGLGLRGQALIGSLQNNASNVFYLDNIAINDAQPVQRSWEIGLETVASYSPAPFR